MTNEAPNNAEQDHEMLEPLNTFIMKTQSNKNKQNKTQSAEESISTTQMRPKKRKKQKKPKSVHFPFDEKRLILLRNYNPERDSINDGAREIQLSSSLIQEVFKFPNGGTKVTVKTQPNANDPVVKE
ncbi:hypothetical protein R6Q59_014440 [Mikania micrantha]